MTKKEVKLIQNFKTQDFACRVQFNYLCEKSRSLMADYASLFQFPKAYVCNDNLLSCK